MSYIEVDFEDRLYNCTGVQIEIHCNNHESTMKPLINFHATDPTDLYFLLLLSGLTTPENDNGHSYCNIRQHLHVKYEYLFSS